MVDGEEGECLVLQWVESQQTADVVFSIDLRSPRICLFPVSLNHVLCFSL